MDTWILGGSIGALYNRTKSGWFDGNCFKDWVQTLVIPYFRHVDNNTPKLLIGDNLACHLSIDVIEICEANNIRMVFLPPNSTHLLQPLDLAVYGPMKSAWRKVITEWKIGEGRFHTSLPKNIFPRLFLNLLTNMNHIQEFAVNGFKISGIYPLNRKKVIDKILRTDISKSSQNLVSQLVLERLAELREASAKKPGAVMRGKKVKVPPGKCVSLEDVATDSSASKFQSKDKLIKIKNTQLNESLYIERQERSLNTFKEMIDYDIPSSSKMYIKLQEASDKKSDSIQKEKSEMLKKKDLFTEKSDLYEDDYDLEGLLFHQKQAQKV